MCLVLGVSVHPIPLKTAKNRSASETPMPPSTTQPMVKPSEPQPPLTLAAKQVIRIELLEGVRGLLACWVMIGHFTLYLGGATLLSNGSHTLLAKAAFLAINGDVPVCLSRYRARW